MGSCLAAFEWDAGGLWNGQPWSPELPTDSALLFYILCAFMAAPQWIFALDGAYAISGPSGTLFLGVRLAYSLAELVIAGHTSALLGLQANCLPNP